VLETDLNLFDTRTNRNEINLIIFFSILLKIGFPPFYNWIVKIVFFMPWNFLFIFLSFQKLGPLQIISFFSSTSFSLFVSLLGVIIGSFFLAPQTRIKIIFTFSSIIHTRWMLSVGSINLINLLIYFFLYSLISFYLFKTCEKFNINFFSNQMNSKIYLIVSILLLSLSGVPPFLGFFLKWILLRSLNFFIRSYFMLFWLVLASVVSVFSYLHLVTKHSLVLSEKNLHFYKI